MSYQVLARKWRPRTFTELVGQEHVRRALENALSNEQLHHAYLFTGTRGVGKTTIARILAKCLNCETGVTATPCEACSACQEISEGRFIDLIEVDAASRTKVEDTRELLDNVQYAPTRGRYKIYLIDEVHMLSGHSFNALLKTLEEPPPHVKFLLATTDPQKLPITVLSRCLQFHLKNLAPEQILQQLNHILKEESITAETPALQQIAEAANGSMRDALSLLDQAIAYGNGQVLTTEVSAMLGTIANDTIIKLLTPLAEKDGKAILDQIANYAEFGVDFNQLLAKLISSLHHIAIQQVVPDASGIEAEFAELSQRFNREEIQLYYQIALVGRRDLPLAPSARIGFEMVMLRMLAFMPSTADAVTPTNTATANAKPPQTTQTATATQAPASTSSDWPTIASQLKLTGLTRSLVQHCSLTNMSDTAIELSLENKHSALLNQSSEQRLQQALADYFGKPMKLSVTTAGEVTDTPHQRNQAVQAENKAKAQKIIENDVNIQALKDTFNASVQKDSLELQPEE